jgi:hypothetical protein
MRPVQKDLDIIDKRLKLYQTFLDGARTEKERQERRKACLCRLARSLAMVRNRSDRSK